MESSGRLGIAIGTRTEKKSLFYDQQPIEASTMAAAAMAAWRLTSDAHYLQRSNDPTLVYRRKLSRSSTFRLQRCSCCDGLMVGGINKNAVPNPRWLIFGRLYYVNPHSILRRQFLEILLQARRHSRTYSRLARVRLRTIRKPPPTLVVR